MSVEFEDYSKQVKERLNKALIAGMHEAAGELESQVVRNTRVDTGQLKGSWGYKVNESNIEAVIGSPLENALWEEFGTGEHSINGNGRKGWKGKAPSRAFFKAYTTKKSTIIKLIQNKLKNL